MDHHNYHHHRINNRHPSHHLPNSPPRYLPFRPPPFSDHHPRHFPQPPPPPQYPPSHRPCLLHHSPRPPLHHRDVNFPHHVHNLDVDDVERRRFRLPETLPPPPPPPTHPIPRFSQIVRPSFDRSPIRQGIGRVSPPPPPFVDLDRFTRDFKSPVRFREDLDRDLLFQLRGGDDTDFRRNRVGDRRVLDGVVEREEFLRRGIDEQRMFVDVVGREELRRNRIDDRRMFVDEREELRRDRIDEGRMFMDEREELHGHRVNDRRIVEELPRERIEERRFRSVVDRDQVLHDPYHPEMVVRDLELNSVGNEHAGGEMPDEMLIKDNDLNVRRVMRKDASRSPIKFRTRSGIEVVHDRVSESREEDSPIKFRTRSGIEVVDDWVSESREEDMNRLSCIDRKRRERERVESLGHHDNSPRKNSAQKKSAFLRLQPAKQPSTSKNRLKSNTPSPHKARQSNVESLEHRSSEESELDVSCKSDTLVAKAVIAAPSSLGVDHIPMSALGNRKSGESPGRVERLRNESSNSVGSRKEEKQSEKVVRVSPILKRAGIRNKVELPDGSTMSSSSGLSSLSGDDVACKASPRIDVLAKGSKNAGCEKVASPNVRKRRRIVTPNFRLSSSMLSNSDVGVSIVDNSVNAPLGGSLSEKSTGPIEKDLPLGDSVIGSNHAVKISDNRKLDVTESPGALMPVADAVHFISDNCSPKEMGKGENVESLPQMPPKVESGTVQNDETTSNSDEELKKAIEKFIADIEKDSHRGRESAPVLVDNGSVEGSSELMLVPAGADPGSNHTFGYMDTCNSVSLTNSISSPIDVSVETENGADLISSVVEVVEPCRTYADGDSIGHHLGNVRMDGDHNDDLNNLRDDAEVGNLSSIDVLIDDASIDSEKVIPVSEPNIIIDTEDQQCVGLGTLLADDEARERKEGSLKVSDSGGGDVTLSSVEEKSTPLVRKRKAQIELDTLDSGTSEFCHDTDLSRNLLKDNSNLPVHKHSFETSSSALCSSGSDVLPGDYPVQRFVEGITSLNCAHHLDLNDHPSDHGKKRKILSSESTFSDVSVSESSDLHASSNALLSRAEAPLNSSNCSAQSAETIIPPKFALCAVGEATDHTTSCSFDEKLKVNFLNKGLCLSDEVSGSVNDKQSLNVSESGCSMKEGEDLMEAGSSGRDVLIVLKPAGEVVTTDHGSSECIHPDCSGDTDLRPLATSMECDNIIAVNGNLPLLSERTHLCAESAGGGATSGSALLDPTSNKGSPGAATISDDKLCEDDKKMLKMQGSLSSQSNLPSGRNEMNLKPRTLAAAGDQPNAQKTASVPSKNTKNLPCSSSLSRRAFPRRNVLTRMSPPSGQVYPITAPNKTVPAFPAKPQTWSRANNPAASKVVLKKPSVPTAPLQRPPLGSALKVQGTSYIRKGNSLVRNPALDGASTSGPCVIGATTVQSMTNDTSNDKKLTGSVSIVSTELPDCLMTGGGNAPVEMPKTPPFPSSDQTSSCDIAYLGDFTSSPQGDQSEGKDNEDTKKSPETSINSYENPETALNKDSEDSGTLSDGVLLTQKTKRITYIKRKSNQLIAASTSSELSKHHMESTPVSLDSNYFKRRKNQLIRASSESNIQQMVAAINDSSNSQPQRTPNVYSGSISTKRVAAKGKSSKVSLVWNLGDSKPSGRGFKPLKSAKLLSHILPWKRATYWRSVWQSSASIPSGSLLKARKLPLSRKRAAVYVRSGLGFSLRRSEVISLAGSLKWSKSMEKYSKKIDKEATLAVAAFSSVKKRKYSSSIAAVRNISSQKSVSGFKVLAGERIFRIGVFRYRMDASRRTLQRIPDEEAPESNASKPEKDIRKTYVPKRLLIGSDEYVRVGNGNQLVRDPKKRTRVLASEKVRWSLHTARMRFAKKRKLCQFFTRFGRCNKGEGKCPYIHDPSKTAVCTKFLNGLCADSSCKLTHKVIPERMPDCSFFLQGLCSNNKCPYRHVNVNPKASICESFLRGYCAEGNECLKKHSYMCPEFEATGSCPQGSKCKLYHPKKAKGKKRKLLKDQKNAGGRYFGSGFTTNVKLESAIPEKDSTLRSGDVASQGEEFGDFISLDVSDDETGESADLICRATYSSDNDPLDSELDVLDELTKPLRILDVPCEKLQ